MNWQLVITWNGGESSSPAVNVAPNEAWRVADDSGSYTFVPDDDTIPARGESVVTNGELVLVDISVISDGKPVVVMPLPSGMCAALALKASDAR